MADDDVEVIAGTDEPTPATEPKSAKAWLAMLKVAERHFRRYQDVCEGIDKEYANMERLASVARDRAYQMFWANVQTLAPSMYARPPVPAVVPRHQDRRPLYRVSSEFLERAVGTQFDMARIDDVMIQVRDDLAIASRGVPWVRYEGKSDNRQKLERCCIDHVDRTDFLHDPARKWADVGWVARRAWLSKAEARKRFRKTSGDAYKDLAYNKPKDNLGDAEDDIAKAGVWEIWSKDQNRVVWCGEGSEKLLDDGEPHLDLTEFFPCPRPAYGTLQRRSTIPVPDYLLYKDQLEEINQFTARLHAIAESLQVRGFYPAGVSEIGDAVEAAMKKTDNRQILIGIANWAAFGDSAPKDMIVWLPIEQIAAVVQNLVALRKELIEDVYQITGLSDIMRGSTEASETATAQQLKANYGSVRIRDRQAELVRVARDLVAIVGEIMAEEFAADTLETMAQMDLPTDKDVADQVKPLQKQIDETTKQVNQGKASPQYKQAMAPLPPGAPPEAAQQQQQMQGQIQQMLAKAQEHVQGLGMQIGKIKDTVTIESVIKLLRNEKLRPFVLDIETDSTIAPDENAQKQRATEYITAMGGLLAQAIPAVQQLPQAAPLVAATISFAQKQFRVGREMDSVVQEFTDAMSKAASEPKPPDPAVQAEQAKQQAMQADQAHKQELEKNQQMIDGQKAQADAAERQAAANKSMTDDQLRMTADQRKNDVHAQDLLHRDTINSKDIELKDLDIQIKKLDLAGKNVDLVAKGAEMNDNGDGAQPAGTRDLEPVHEGILSLHDAIGQLDAKHSAKRRIVKDPVTGEVQGVEIEGFGMRPVERDPTTGEVAAV